MVKVAFSTVACPDWTLDRVAAAASRWGFQGVELRTFGWAGTRLACEPALTSGAKVRRMFGEAGVEIAGVGTGVRFDEPVFPPVIGHAISDTNKSVVAAKRTIEIAHAIGAPYVRVFGFEPGRREKFARFQQRVAGRIALAADAARNMDVTVVVENAGIFAGAQALKDLLDEIEASHSSIRVRACYNLANAVKAGDDLAQGIDILGSKLVTARVKDLNASGMPVPLGAGTLPVREFVRAVAHSRSARWLVFEWDKLWLPELSGADEVMPGAASSFVRMVAEARGPVFRTGSSTSAA